MLGVSTCAGSAGVGTLDAAGAIIDAWARAPPGAGAIVSLVVGVAVATGIGASGAPAAVASAGPLLGACEPMLPPTIGIGAWTALVGMLFIDTVDRVALEDEVRVRSNPTADPADDDSGVLPGIPATDVAQLVAGVAGAAGVPFTTEIG